VRAAGWETGSPASFGTPSLPFVPEAEAYPPRRSGALCSAGQRAEQTLTTISSSQCD
jgi:hypothetical protein